MDIAQKILIKNNNLKLELKSKEEIKIVEQQEEAADIKIKTINIEEYDVT